MSGDGSEGYVRDARSTVATEPPWAGIKACSADDELVCTDERENLLPLAVR
jgi:hypothetical protein